MTQQIDALEIHYRASIRYIFSSLEGNVFAVTAYLGLCVTASYLQQKSQTHNFSSRAKTRKSEQNLSQT